MLNPLDLPYRECKETVRPKKKQKKVANRHSANDFLSNDFSDLYYGVCGLTFRQFSPKKLFPICS